MISFQRDAACSSFQRLSTAELVRLEASSSFLHGKNWTPAFAGMTGKRGSQP